MPGNAPNASRDSFVFANMYDKVALQQGVPIPDSDWNEMNDILRMATILIGKYAFGDFRGIDGGFGNVLAGSVGAAGGPASNNFSIDAGLAMVDGVLIPTDLSEPPAAINYEETPGTAADNYIVKGIVTAVNGGAGTITDDTKLFAALHNLLAGGGQATGCRVRMTSGAESGNDFEITAFTPTTLTLNGGIGGILATDTYEILPPALTTPGAGARTDGVYLQVWWEDFAGEEDTVTPIIHPGLGIETAHRAQRRWCVRVTEDVGSNPVPTTPVAHGFGVRYLKLWEVTRPNGEATFTTANGNVYVDFNLGSSFIDHVNDTSDPHSVTAAQVDFTPVGIIAATDVQAAIAEILTDFASTIGAANVGVEDAAFTAAALSSLGGGGVGSPVTILQAALDSINSQLVRRRAYTAVITDGTASVGGDHDGANAIDVVNDGTYSSGIFLLRRGTHTFSAPPASDRDIQVIGEASDLSIVQRTATTGDENLHGHWSQVRVGDSGGTGRWNLSGNFKNVLFEHGTIVSDTLVSTFRDCAWVGLTSTDPGIIYAHEIAGTIASQLYENCTFSGDDGTATMLAACRVNNAGVASNPQAPLIFRKCTFTAEDTDCRALLIDGLSQSQSIIFEDCIFEGDSGDNHLVEVTGGNAGVIFHRCTFDATTGVVLRAAGTSKVCLSKCTLIAGNTPPPGGFAQAVVLAGTGGVEVYDCEILLDDGALLDTASMTAAAVEIAGESSTATNPVICIVDGLRIRNTSSVSPRFSPVVLNGYNGASSAESPYRYSNITYDNSDNVAGAAAETGVQAPAFIEAASTGDVMLLENITAKGIETGAEDSVMYGLYFESAIVKTATVEGANTPTGGAGQIFNGAAAIGCARTQLHDPQLFSVSIPDMNGNVATLIMLGDDSHMYGGELHRTTGASIAVAITVGLRSTAEGFRCSAPGLAGIEVVDLDGIGSSILNFVIIPTSGSWGALVSDSSGSEHRVLGCTMRQPAGGGIVNLTDDNCIVDGNILNSTSGTATITNSGTGSVTGDNVAV